MGESTIVGTVNPPNPTGSGGTSASKRAWIRSEGRRKADLVLPKRPGILCGMCREYRRKRDFGKAYAQAQNRWLSRLHHNPSNSCRAVELQFQSRWARSTTFLGSKEPPGRSAQKFLKVLESALWLFDSELDAGTPRKKQGQTCCIPTSDVLSTNLAVPA